jgi:hypothetical protein
MKIGFRMRPSFRHGHRCRRNSFADPPNYVLGATYVVVVAIVFVSTWLTLENIFAAPPPGDRRPQIAAAAEDRRGFVPAYADRMMPVPHFDRAIELPQIGATEPGARKSFTEAALDRPEPTLRPEEKAVTSRSVDASGASEPAASATPEATQKPATPRNTDVSSPSAKFRLQLAAVKSARPASVPGTTSNSARPICLAGSRHRSRPPISPSSAASTASERRR